MKSNRSSKVVVIFTVAILIIVSACSSDSLPFVSTMTPYPTYTIIPKNTPYPTYTPYPTLTKAATFTPYPQMEEVNPPKWDISIINVEKSLTFGIWEFKETDNAEFLILTISYTNITDERQAFAPQSLLLVFPEATSYPGSAMQVSEYQKHGSSQVVSFKTTGAFFEYIDPGETRLERFGWELLELNDSGYKLLFPETKAIDVVIPAE